MKSLLLLGTGFIGGALLIKLLSLQFNIRVIVRKSEQIETLKTLGCEVILINSENQFDIVKSQSKLSDIVINTADSDSLVLVKSIIEGIKERNDKNSIFIHTSGTGLLIGLPDEPFDDMNMNDIHVRIPISALHKNIDQYIFDETEGHFKTVIISPSTVYGVGNGPFNKITLQLPQIVKAQIQFNKPGYLNKEEWDNIHIDDCVDMYEIILNNLLGNDGKEQYFGKSSGFYFGGSDIHTWDKISEKSAIILKNLGHLKTDSPLVLFTNEETKSLRFPIDSWGRSRSFSNRAKKLGWSPKKPSIYDTMESEIKYLIENKLI